MGRTAQQGLLFLLFILLNSCSTGTLVALAPNPDGSTGRISVVNAAGSVTLDTPYQATSIAASTGQPTPPVVMGKDALDKIFHEAFSIQPKQPLHFLLYFDKDTTLTADSLTLLPDIITAIRERGGNDISVVGHTDTVGSSEYNTTLSKNRAIAVKELLAQRGVDPVSIRTTSHGKENPLILTGDNVNEPRNRRVEVVVR